MVRTSPTPASAPSRVKPRSAKPILIAMFLITFAPILGAVIMYLNPQWWPDESSNYGQLIKPQRDVPPPSALPLATLDGQAFDLASLKGKWLLMAADGGACPESCARKLFIIRNTHASQGKNVERLARVWFITDDAPVPQKVLDAYRGTIMVRARPEQLAPFLLGTRAVALPAGGAGGLSSDPADAASTASSAASSTASSAMVSVSTVAPATTMAPTMSPAADALAGPMWVVDPLGHLMLRFPANADPIKVRQDVSKLIYNSRIG